MSYKRPFSALLRCNTDRGWKSNYESTSEDDRNPKKKQKQQHQSNLRSRAKMDMQNDSHGYEKPNLDTATDLDYPQEMPNLRFYRNQITFEPYGVTIQDIHDHWRNDYRELEENHCYIQWLFPLREPGVNPHATPLTSAEIRMMRADERAMRRLLESYKLMLGFYGIHLLDAKTGEVSRAENWEERYHNLNRRSHNNLRITRILKCLGEMGYDHLQAPLVQFFLKETMCNNQLPNVKRSVLDYFMFTVKDKQRRKLVQFARENYKSQEQFIWGQAEKLRRENEGKAEEMEDNEMLAPHHNEPYHHHQQETRTGGGMGDNGGPGMGRTQDHGASEQRDGVSSSRNKQTTWGKPITEDYSLANKKGTDSTRLIPIRDKAQGTRRGNEGLPKAKTSFGKKNKTTRGANLENKTQPKNLEERHNLLGARGAFEHGVRIDRKSKPTYVPKFLIRGKFKVTFIFCLVFLAFLTFPR